MELEYKDFPIIDCDKILHHLFKKTNFVADVKKLFGSWNIYSDDEKKIINRKKISEIIFIPENEVLKKKYLFYVYRKLGWEIIKQMYKIFIIKKNVVAILEAAVLFETVIFKYICFPIVLIFVDNEEESVRRIKLRDPHLTENDIRTRIRNQINYLVKMR